MGSEAPSWADQWGSNGAIDHYNDESNDNKHTSNKGKKMESVKAAASVGLDKAKVGATWGAQKVKSGTSISIKWVKNQYQKRTSK